MITKNLLPTLCRALQYVGYFLKSIFGVFALHYVVTRINKIFSYI